MIQFHRDSAKLTVAQAVGEGGQMLRGGNSKPWKCAQLFQASKRGLRHAVHARAQEL